MRLILVALVVVASLAGCAESDDGGDMEMAADTALTTGFLRGIVIDPAIRPIENAEVTILSNGTEQAILTTDADGNFGVGDLAAGTYDVVVRKPGYDDATAVGDVIAGELTPEPIQITLVPVPVDDSFVWPILWEGVVTCGFTQNFCAGIDAYAGTNFFGDESFLFLFDEFMAYQRTPDLVQVEVVWEPNTPVSEWATGGFWASTWEEWEECVCTPNPLGAQDGDGYLFFQIDRETMEPFEVGLTTGLGVAFSVWQPSSTEAVTSNPERLASAMVNQPFEAFFHVFYGCLPPEGWLFTVDGEPPCDPESLSI